MTTHLHTRRLRRQPKKQFATLLISAALILPSFNPGDVGQEHLLKALRERGKQVDERDAKIRTLERKNRRLNRIAYRAKLAYLRTRRTLLHSPSIYEAITLAAIVYRVPASTLIRKGWCESHLQRYAHNPSGATSYWQFLPSTWRSTPFGRLSIYSPYAQALGTAWMIGPADRGGEWVCQ